MATLEEELRFIPKNFPHLDRKRVIVAPSGRLWLLCSVIGGETGCQDRCQDDPLIPPGLYEGEIWQKGYHWEKPPKPESCEGCVRHRGHCVNWLLSGNIERCFKAQ